MKSSMYPSVGKTSGRSLPEAKKVVGGARKRHLSESTKVPHGFPGSASLYNEFKERAGINLEEAKDPRALDAEALGKIRAAQKACDEAQIALNKCISYGDGQLEYKSFLKDIHKALVLCAGVAGEF